MPEPAAVVPPTARMPCSCAGHISHVTCPKRPVIEARWGSKPLAFAGKLHHGDSSSSRFRLTTPGSVALRRFGDDCAHSRGLD
jgi:hypothetical protein